jgi:hypothetical protein
VNGGMTAEERDLLAVAVAVAEAVGVVAPPPAPAWRISRRSVGACVAVAAIPAAGGICNCGNDPNCSICHGEGTVQI